MARPQGRSISGLFDAVKLLTQGQKNLVEATADELLDACPELSLNEVLVNQPGNSALDKVEIMFPRYWKGLSAILFKSTREVFRAYSLWQLFVQTHFLLQDEHTSHKYETMLRNIEGRVSITL